jgi:small subunit ribosomal protein S35
MTRHFHSSISARNAHQGQQPEETKEDDFEELENFDEEDLVATFTDAESASESTAAGHLKMRHERHLLHYLRLIEEKVPYLVEFRVPFTPPTSATPLIVRSVDYAGEEHPATIKRTVVVPVAQLPLRDEDAIHKFKILAGVRWTPVPPKDAGVGPNETGREHGYIKIACEDFPEPAQNLKWASDVIERLLKEANNPKDTFKDIPHDTRHLVAKARKAKLGEHRSGRIFHRPSIRDFPKEWLPEPKERLIVPDMDDTERAAVAE